jgi:hypothetical protein
LTLEAEVAVHRDDEKRAEEAAGRSVLVQQCARLRRDPIMEPVGVTFRLRQYNRLCPGIDEKEIIDEHGMQREVCDVLEENLAANQRISCVANAENEVGADELAILYIEL